MANNIIMKEVKFRIIELPTHQVLLTKDFDQDDGSPTVTLTLFYDGVKVTQTMGFENENKRDTAFDDISPEHAQQLVDATQKQFEG